MTTLERIERISRRIAELAQDREQLIDQALAEGYSERKVSKAAGWSPTTIHMRRKHGRHRSFTRTA